MTGLSSETPPEDVLRFDETGRRLSEAEFHAVLDDIIKSWPKWDWNATTVPPERRKNYLAETVPPPGDSTKTLSGKQGRMKAVTTRWLSKK